MIWERLGIARWALYGSIALHLCLALLIIWTEFMQPQTDRGAAVQWIRARLIPESPAPVPPGGKEGRVQERRPAPLETPEVRTPEPMPPAQAVVEPQTAEDERALRESEERARRQAEEEARRRAEAERRAALERQRQAEAERRRQESEAQARRQAEERARQQAESERAARERAEAERRRQAEERARLQAEAERKRLEEEAERLASEESARLKAEEETRRRQLAEEAERLAQIEERRLAEEMQRLAEAQTQSAADRGEVAGRGQQSGGSDSEALRESQRYIPLIRERVRQFWARPLASEPGLSAVVRVRLLPGGEVVPGSVRIIKSSGHTAFDQSVIAAVYRASPLPVPSGAAFEPFREFDFTFRP